ncbi:MAG: hypothetical protein IPM14_11425 [bacterium]|nr:hypothetical protein [bacterium]
MKKSIIFLFISLIAVSSSCDDSTTNSYFPNSLIPFKLNNSWESVHFLYDSSGIPFYTDTIVAQIVKDTVISGIRFYKYGLYSIDHYTSKDDGIWLYFFHFVDSTEEHSLYFKYPCKQGDTYNFTLGRPHAVVTVLSTNQNIQVEAGTFSCILYRFDLEGLDSYHNYYIAQGVGIVKAESYRSKVSGTFFKSAEDRLLSYHLN